MKTSSILVICYTTCMILSFVVLMPGACGCFPAGRTLSEEQVKQKNNETLLRLLAKQILEDTNLQTNAWSFLKDGEFHINTNSEFVYISVFPCHELLIDTFRTRQLEPDPSIITNFESRIIAYEKSGLWSDGTVSVFLQDLGIMRMLESDLNELLEGKGKCLKYFKGKRCWVSQKNKKEGIKLSVQEEREDQR